MSREQQATAEAADQAAVEEVAPPLPRMPLTTDQRDELRRRADVFERIAAATLDDIKTADARLKAAAMKSPALEAIRVEVVEAVLLFDRLGEFTRLSRAFVRALSADADGKGWEDVWPLMQKLRQEPGPERTFKVGRQRGKEAAEDED